MNAAKKLIKDKRFRVAVIALLIAAAVNRGLVAADQSEALQDSLTAILEILLTP